MGDDDKPFACQEEGCGMRFANEDHLSVHRMKHEMSLALTSGGGKLTNNLLFVADQTPTPTKFLRNCEEIGLFHDLSKNPFEEAFKKAAQEHLPHPGGGDTVEISIHVPLPGPSHEVKSTLDTPTVHLVKTAVPPAIDIIDTPEPGLHPTPAIIEHVEDSSDMETAVVVEEEVIEVSVVSPPSQPPSVSEPALAKSSPSPIPPSPTEMMTDSSEMVTSADEAVPTPSPGPVTTPAPTPSPAPAIRLVESVPTTAKVSAAAPDTKSVVTNVGAVKQVVTPNVTTGVIKQPQIATMQVLLQLPNGQTVPVHIPAAINGPALQISSSTPTTQLAPKIASKRPTTIMAAATSTSTLAKQKLKQALVGNAQQSVLNNEAVERVSVQQSSSQSALLPGNRHSPTASAVASSSSSSGAVFVHGQVKAGPTIEMQAADTSTPFHKKPRKSNEEDADERRRKFLERNRAAAARCRMKRKSWIVNLEKKAEDVQSHNTKLTNEMAMLRKEVAHLKMLLLAHKDCPITKAQQAAGQLPVPLPDGQLADGRTVQTIELREGCFQVVDGVNLVLQEPGQEEAVDAAAMEDTVSIVMQPSPCSSDLSISNSHTAVTNSPQPSSP